MLTRSLVVVLALLGLLLVATTVAPVGVRAVDDAAMAPTIDPGDAYVVVESDSVEAGDVVVFWSPERGEFLTRRVVERTETGFLTRGDAAEAADQDAGLSPVPRSGIVGVVPTAAGRLAVLPAMGGPVSFAGRHGVVLVALLALVAAGLVTRPGGDYRRGTPGRSVWRVRDVVRVVFVVALVASIALTPMGATGVQLTFLATEDGGESKYAVPVGEPVTRTIAVPAVQPPLSRLVVDADGMTVEDWVWNGSTLSVAVTVPPASATGPRPTAVSVYPYPAVLPRPILESLHGIHPIVAVLGSAAAILALPLLVYLLLLVDGERPIDVRRARRRVERFVRKRR